MTVSDRHSQPRPGSNRLLFRIAFARARPCYFYGCICLTKDERACQRRVFGLAHAWGKSLEKERRRLDRERRAQTSSRTGAL
jgi:hypothetical protein